MKKASEAYEPISSQRLYRQVAKRIEELIAKERIAPGNRLPSEKDMAALLGVSRPTVREAMVAMEIAGLIEVRTGSGIYVRQRKAVEWTPIDSGPGPFELLSARMLIEGEIAASVAPLVTERDLREIRGTIVEMEEALSREEDGRPLDRAFHKRIAAVTGNSVLTSLVETMWSNMFTPMFIRLSKQTGLGHRHQMALADHKMILAALSTRDAVGARATMRLHLLHVREVLAHGLEDEAELTEQTVVRPGKPGQSINGRSANSRK